MIIGLYVAEAFDTLDRKKETVKKNNLKMLTTEKLSSTPTRLVRDLFPSSPDSRFSSPNFYGTNTWTPARATLWPMTLTSGPDSSPSHRFASFPTPGNLDLTPNQCENSAQKNDNCKRGRPRADVITHLIYQGSSSPSGIKCKVCNRVFPREKSLQVGAKTIYSH